MLAAIWVTTDCNMQCKYCYEGSEKPQKAMSVKIADRAIEYVKSHFDELDDDILIVTFHGGEPLLQFDLIKYIVKKLNEIFSIDKRRLMFGITTNGILINKEMGKYLSDNFDYSLSVSIDGTKLTHDANRVLKNGQGTYDLVIEKFKGLLNNKPNTRARMTFNPYTVGNLYLNVEHLVDLGFTTIAPIPDYFDQSWDESHIEILYKELEKISELSSRLRKENKLIRVGLVDDLDFKNKGKCSGGRTTIHIDPEGKLYPCTYTVGNEEFIIGNVEDGIINEKVNEIYELSGAVNIECKGCTHYDFCIGTRCKLVNKAITGEYTSPPAILCSVENIKYKIFKSNTKI